MNLCSQYFNFIKFTQILKHTSCLYTWNELQAKYIFNQPFEMSRGRKSFVEIYIFSMFSTKISFAQQHIWIHSLLNWAWSTNLEYMINIESISSYYTIKPLRKLHDFIYYTVTCSNFAFSIFHLGLKLKIRILCSFCIHCSQKKQRLETLTEAYLRRRILLPIEHTFIGKFLCIFQLGWVTFECTYFFIDKFNTSGVLLGPALHSFS